MGKLKYSSTHWKEVNGQVHSPAVLTRRKRTPLPHRMRDFVSHTAGLNIVAERKYCLAGNRTSVVQPLVRLILLDLIALLTFGEECKLGCTSFSNFLQPAVVLLATISNYSYSYSLQAV
jgi:hypothetical protein